MALRETTADGSEIMNVDAKVGKAKLNGWGDVLVIQALLKYVREGRGGERGYDFLPPGSPPLRNPDGIFYPGETDKLILAYQKATNRDFRRQVLTEDGVISHASGKSTLGGKKWTVVDLNHRAEIMCLAKGRGDDYFKDIQKAYPQVRMALNEFTLNF